MSEAEKIVKRMGYTLTDVRKGSVCIIDCLCALRAAEDPLTIKQIQEYTQNVYSFPEIAQLITVLRTETDVIETANVNLKGEGEFKLTTLGVTLCDLLTHCIDKVIHEF